jgi:hypothetical protein
MNTKQKFQRIDQSKLDEKQVGILKAISQKTNDFKTKDKEVLEKIDLALDKIIAALEEKNPEALKPITTKKTTSKTKAKPKKSAPSKPTAMSLAKEIRRADESWNDAVKRASDIMKNNKAQAKKTVDTELQKLLKIVRTRKELEGFKDSDILRDSVRTAKPRGKRVVTKQGFTSNQYGTFENKIGRKYWESRDGHADRLSPAYPKDMPLLENGGSVSNERMYNFLKDDLEQLREATNSGNAEVVNRFFSYWLGSSGHLKSLLTKTNERMYNFLKEDLVNLEKAINDGDKKEVERFFSYWNQHLESLKMESGGGLGKSVKVKLTKDRIKAKLYKPSGDFFIEDKGDEYILHFTPKDAASNFQNLVNMNAKDVGNGYYGSAYSVNKVLETKYADGGEFMTDPTFGNFQNQVYADGGNVGKKRYTIQYNVGKVKYLVSYHDGVQKHKDGSNFYDIATFKNKEMLNDFVQDLIKKGYKELHYSESFELGGNVMPDLAGHMGGKFGTGDPSMLNGFTGTHYDGLVGETGAMSAGELFMDGGVMMQNQAIIDAASQPYVNYYLGEGASAGIFKSGGKLKSTPSLEQLAIEQIASLTGTNVAAVKEFTKEENLSEREVLALMQALGTKTIDKEEFVILIVGDKSTSGYKKTKSEVMKTIKSDKMYASKPRKYIDHDDIAYVNVMRNGKEVSYKGTDVFNGVNTFDDGGKISSKANYIPKREIVYVTLKNGHLVTPANGYWVKKDAKPVPMSITKKSFADGGNLYEKNDGFMEMDNERRFRSPIFNQEVEPVDIPMDLSSDYIGRKPLEDGLEEDIDLSEGRIRAIKRFSAGNPDKLLSVNPNAYEHLNLPKPNGKTHKND